MNPKPPLPPTANPVAKLLNDVQRRLGTAAWADAARADPALVANMLRDVHFQTAAILAAMGQPVGTTEIERRLAQVQKDALLHSTVWDLTFSRISALWDCWREGKDNTQIAQMLYDTLHNWTSEPLPLNTPKQG
jgi:hypothetical protein